MNDLHGRNQTVYILWNLWNVNTAHDLRVSLLSKYMMQRKYLIAVHRLLFMNHFAWFNINDTLFWVNLSVNLIESLSLHFPHSFPFILHFTSRHITTYSRIVTTSSSHRYIDNHPLISPGIYWIKYIKSTLSVPMFNLWIMLIIIIYESYNLRLSPFHSSTLSIPTDPTSIPFPFMIIWWSAFVLILQSRLRRKGNLWGHGRRGHHSVLHW